MNIKDLGDTNGKNINKIMKAIDLEEKECGIRFLKANQNAEGIDFKVGKRTHRLLLLLRDFFIISCRNLERNRKNA